MVADIEELEEMDASELHARRLNAKEVLKLQRSGNFTVPIADGTVKIFGREQRLRTSTLTWDCPERGDEQEILQGKSNELHSPTPLEDSSWYDDEAGNSFWSISGEFIFRHHVEPRVKLYVPREETFPVPMKYIDVTGTTYRSLELSDACTGFTRFVLLKERPPEGYTWSVERLTWKQNNLSS